MVERDGYDGDDGWARDVPPPVPPRKSASLRDEGSIERRPAKIALRSSGRVVGQDGRVVEFATVREDVRVGVRRDAQLALSDETADLGPGAALSMEERDAPVSQVMRREGRDSGGFAGPSDCGAEAIRANSGEKRCGWIAVFARLERRFDCVGERVGAARPGRKAGLRVEVVARIRDEHTQARSLGAIARDLNADAVPTAQGGRQWWPSTVRAVLVRQGRLESTERR